MARLERDNLEEERIKRLKRGILITGYEAIEETETNSEAAAIRSGYIL